MNGIDPEAWLLWSLGLNYALLLLWFLVFAYAHDALQGLHERWFRLSPEAFDTVHYAGMGLYKIAIILLNLVPYLALLATRQTR